LIASAVGFLTIVLAVWIWRTEPGRWLRWLGVAALAAVIAQGLLGGLTVLFFLPAAVSTAHAALAEIFFCMTVAIAVFTSPGWIRGYGAERFAAGADGLPRLAVLTTILIFVQMLIGAAMRHTGAGLAIPDFPLMFGGVVPDRWSPAIAVHFAHRAGALAVSALIAVLVRAVWTQHRQRPELTQPALLLAALVVAQVTLGALTVLTRRDPWINSFHVVGGALVLTTSLVITLRSWRIAFGVRDVLLASGPIADSVKDVRVPAGPGIVSARLPAFASLPALLKLRRAAAVSEGDRRGAPERGARRRQPHHRGRT
jgi:cytochrome c oxidase assembly protein subunit 15